MFVGMLGFTTPWAQKLVSRAHGGVHRGMGRAGRRREVAWDRELWDTIPAKLVHCTSDVLPFEPLLIILLKTLPLYLGLSFSIAITVRSSLMMAALYSIARATSLLDKNPNQVFLIPLILA